MCFEILYVWKTFGKSDTFCTDKNVHCGSVIINFVLHVYVLSIILFLLVPFRVYDYLIFAATSVGEGPPVNGRFLTREDSELHCIIHHQY